MLRKDVKMVRKEKPTERNLVLHVKALQATKANPHLAQRHLLAL